MILYQIESLTYEGLDLGTDKTLGVENKVGQGKVYQFGTVLQYRI